MTGESQPEKTTPTTPQSAPTAPDTAPATPDDSPREFDVVVFGATGFVGELTARYLAEQYGERFTPPALLLEKAAQGDTFR